MKNNAPLFWNELFVREHSLFRRYTFSILLSVSSLLLMNLFWKYEGGYPVTSFAMLAVIFSAIYGGRGPAILNTIITSIGIDYFFSIPVGQILESSTSFIRVIIYLLIGLSVAGIVNSLRQNLILLRKQKEQLQFEKQARENILSIVSHDLRSPLSSILMNTEFILRGLSSGKSDLNTPKLLDNIQKSGKRMNRLIEDLLDSVRIESGNFKLQLNDSDIVEVVSASIEESRSAAISKGVELKLDSSIQSECISCDSERIIQVLNNLLSNAVKFSPDNSEVIIRLDTTEKKIHISVKDFGLGISPEDQANLFERYWQSKHTAHKGTGLGLYISKKIIEAHGGEIYAFSKIGEGSEFHIVLPAD